MEKRINPKFTANGIFANKFIVKRLQDPEESMNSILESERTENYGISDILRCRS